MISPPVTRRKQNPFRSQGETQIARCLARAGIDYRYEHPLAVVDDGRVKIWYPDFQFTRYGIIMEYCGLTEDPAYRNGMKKKQEVYQANGLTALIFTPDLFKGDWPNRLLNCIEHTLTDRVKDFQNSRYHGPKAHRLPTWAKPPAQPLPGYP
jgi:hypothetical protein